MNVEKRIAEVLNVEKVNVERAPRVVELRPVLSRNSMGDPAIFIDVILDEATPDTERCWSSLEPIHDRIRQRLRDADIHLFPHLRFVKDSELRELGAA